MDASLWDSTLGVVADQVAGREPGPAGVAAAAVAATLGVGLLVKVLEIRGKRADLRDAARELAQQLRALADADCAAVRAGLKSAEAREIPVRAARYVLRALLLCREAAPVATGLLGADLRAGREILMGAARAILACAEANLEKAPSAEAGREIAELREGLARLG